MKYELSGDVLRRLQLTQLSMLKDVDRICKKNNITYYLAFGTCLGAARHKGFIPWDDDLDISMPIKDYFRFLEIGKNELDKKYFIQTFETDKNYHRAFAKIRLNNTTMMDRSHRKWSVHQGIWIDVFPIVQINSGIELTIKRALLRASNYVQAENFVLANYDEFRKMLGPVGIKSLRLFYKIPEKVRMDLHRNMLGILFNAKRKKHYCEIGASIYFAMTKEVFVGKKQELLFEDAYFSTFPNWDLYLTQCYGDYMTLPPEEKRINHGNLIIDFDNDYRLYKQ